MSLPPHFPSPASTPDGLQPPALNHQPGHSPLPHIQNGGSPFQQIDGPRDHPPPGPVDGAGQVHPADDAELLDQGRLRQEIEQKLVQLVQELYELEICAGEVVEGQEQRVPQILGRVNKKYIELEELSSKMTDTVPKNVVELVDIYKNPHVYTKNSLIRAVGENQYALGRMVGLESFRRHLSDAVSTEFPAVPLPPRRHSTSKGGQKPNGEQHDGHADGETASRIKVTGVGHEG